MFRPLIINPKPPDPKHSVGDISHRIIICLPRALIRTHITGYRNEHHDFSGVHGVRLPEVKHITKEFYETMRAAHQLNKSL
ncbi:hypothetical protein ACLKA7_001254 [Drosophila subpalustris]